MHCQASNGNPCSLHVVTFAASLHLAAEPKTSPESWKLSEVRLWLQDPEENQCLLVVFRKGCRTCQQRIQRNAKGANKPGKAVDGTLMRPSSYTKVVAMPPSAIHDAAKQPQ